MKTASTKSPRKSTRAKFDSLQQEAYLSLWRTYDRLKSLEDALFGQYDLSPQQYNTLRLLRSVHPGTMPTLALGARLVSRAPDVTRLLDKLEQRGLIERERRAQQSSRGGNRHHRRRACPVGRTGRAGARLPPPATGPSSG